MSVGDRLRQVRGLKTLQEFAEKLEVGGSNISNIENGRSKLSTDLAIRIAQVYDVSIDWLLMGVGNMKQSENQSEETRSDYVSISKDELLKLQRLALDKTIEEKEAAQMQVKKLQNDH